METSKKVEETIPPKKEEVPIKAEEPKKEEKKEEKAKSSDSPFSVEPTIADVLRRVEELEVDNVKLRLDKIPEVQRKVVAKALEGKPVSEQKKHLEFLMGMPELFAVPAQGVIPGKQGAMEHLDPGSMEAKQARARAKQAK